ncbi:MAG: polysaccharide deacetylase family protein [Candidatus Hydrogenedentes bacterium]|nr:polysaccharide deacetylase family protein [Candidatus Hydrogenedentota bacterium]
MPPTDIKGAVKKAVKRAALFAPPVFRRSGSRILTYHSVGQRAHEMNVSPSDFRRQMDWLKQVSRVVSFEAAAGGEGGVAITFDDGYLDNYTNAAPVLLELDMPATFFVVAGRVGRMLDHDTDPDSAALMSWQNIKDLQSARFEIGCHTKTHPRLARLDRGGQNDEIAGAKGLIEQQIGREVASFAYPFGSRDDYNELSIAIVREAGFRQAASNRYGVNTPGANRFDLRRIWVDRSDTFNTFKAKVDGRLDVLAALDSRAGMAARRLLNRLTAPR